MVIDFNAKNQVNICKHLEKKSWKLIAEIYWVQSP